MAGAAPHLALPLPPRLHPPPHPSPKPAMLPPHSLLPTTPGETPRPKQPYRGALLCPARHLRFCLCSQFPCLWTVGCSELSPSHSPCTPLHGPLSSENPLPSHGRATGAVWPPGPTHPFWGEINLEVVKILNWCLLLFINTWCVFWSSLSLDTNRSGGF